MGGHDLRLDRPLLRVVCNRDEQRSRAAAAPPAVFGLDRVVMPIDPTSGGSWIAANDRGVVFALLNSYETPRGSSPTARPDRPSRGVIVPTVALGDTVSLALERALAIDVTRYEPFRLLLIDRYQLVECWPEDDRLRYRRSFLQGPVMRTSSSLGNGVVAGPRRMLFRRFLTGASDAAAAQNAFHDHQWPGQEHLSVRMGRPDACTVSRTTVEVNVDAACMTYAASDGAPPRRVWLPLRRDAGRVVACW
jgi:hypothetical protein